MPDKNQAQSVNSGSEVNAEQSQLDKIKALQDQLAEQMAALQGQDAIKAAQNMVSIAKESASQIKEANKAEIEALNEFKANLFDLIASQIDVDELVTYLENPLVMKDSVNITGQVGNETLTISIRRRVKTED